MSSSNRVAIQEEFQLPSNGKFNGIPAVVQLRAMTLLDEKRRLAGQGLKSIIDCVDRCIVTEGVSAFNMCAQDVDFLMIKLRTITYGAEYKMSFVCSECGKTVNTSTNLDDLEVTYAPEDFSSVFKIGPLPISGDVLTVQELDYNGIFAIDTEAQRILAKFPNYEGDPTDILNYVYKIKEVNGEQLPFPHLKQYVETMPAMDSIYFDEMYDKHSATFGISEQVVTTCTFCNATQRRSLPYTGEFFRPRFDTV